MEKAIDKRKPWRRESLINLQKSYYPSMFYDSPRKAILFLRNTDLREFV